MMLLGILLPIVVALPGVALSAWLQVSQPDRLSLRLHIRGALIEAVVWICCIQMVSEWVVLSLHGAWLQQGDHIDFSLSPLWVLARIALVFPLFLVCRLQPINGVVGICLAILWSILFNCDLTMANSWNIPYSFHLFGFRFLIFDLTPISIMSLLSGTLWFISLQLTRDLPSVYKRDLLSMNRFSTLRVWYQAFIVQTMAAQGILLASALNMATAVQRTRMVTLSQIYILFSISLLCWLLWKAMSKIRTVLHSIEEQARQQREEAAERARIRRQQISRILNGAQSGVFFWESAFAARDAGSSDWRTGTFEFDIEHLGLDLSTRVPRNLDAFFRSVFPASEMERLHVALRGVFAGTENNLSLELNLRAEADRPRPVKLIAQAVRPTNGLGVLYFDGLILDYHDEKRLQQALHDSAEIKKQTLFSVGHDLGSPLGLIRMTTSLMRRKISAGAQGKPLSGSELESYAQEKLARIDGCVMEAYAYLKNALDLAQSEDPEHRYPVTDLAVDQWLHALVDAQMAIYGVNERQVSLEVPEGAVMQQVQEQAFQMVATNLVSNSFKYGSQQGGYIRIVLSDGSSLADGPAVIFEVIDQGQGIPVEIKDALYTPFRRGDNTAHVGGTGLGLSLVRHAIACLNAKIELLDVPKGTHFRVTVPVALATGRVARTA